MRYSGAIKKNEVDLSLPAWKIFRDIMLIGKKKQRCTCIFTCSFIRSTNIKLLLCVCHVVFEAMGTHPEPDRGRTD